MLSVVALMTLLTTTGDVAVVTLATPDVALSTVDAVEATTRDELLRTGLIVATGDLAVDRTDARRCRTDFACLAVVAKRSSSRVVVRLELASVAGDVALLAQLISVADARVLSSTSAILPSAGLLASLRTQLKSVVAAARAAVPQPAVVETKPALVPEASPPLAVSAAPTSNVLKTVGIVGLISGVVAAGVGVTVFATAGSVDKNDLGYVERTQASRVPGIQAQQMTGLTATGVGGALAVAGALTWALAPSNAPVAVSIGPNSLVVRGQW